jgi:hypothetical protein
VPTGTEGRDAVHIAIVPAIAGDNLERGWSVKLNGKNEAEACNSENAIGVVDPFRRWEERFVSKGSWFWLCLYPKTITGLRHVWEHPSFPEAAKPAPITKHDDERSHSKRWLTDYVRRWCPHWIIEPDGGYSKFISNVTEDKVMFYSGNDCHGKEDVVDAEDLYRHLSVVLGKQIDASYFTEFTCSC